MTSSSARRSGRDAPFRLLLPGLLAGALIEPGAAPLRDFVPVAVRYTPATDTGVRRRALEEMRRLRFNTVWLVNDPGARPDGLAFIDRLLAGAPYAGLPEWPSSTLAVLPVAGDGPDPAVRAWTALSNGARAFVFDDWIALERNASAMRSAAQFADAVTRNAVLYASLAPADASAGRRRVQVQDGSKTIQARLLESEAALVLIAINAGRAARAATLSFSQDVPEAIWRNMFNGGSVTFIAGRDGPTYPRTFGSGEVVVLAISKGRR